MALVQLPKLFLSHLMENLSTHDVISIGDTSKPLREFAAYELSKRKTAFFERFLYPGTQWEFKDAWRVPYEIIQDLPEDKKPSLYKRVGIPGYSFEKAIQELDDAYDRGDTGTYQLGWGSLTGASSMTFIKATWGKYPWCRHVMNHHKEFSWDDAVQHPERYDFKSLSLQHQEAYQIASEYPHLPWDKAFLRNHNPHRYTELTIDRIIKLGLTPSYEVYNYPCVSIEDILTHPELKWEHITTLSRHRELSIDILKKYPEGLKPDGWHPDIVSWYVPLQDILENPDAFPWDASVVEKRIKKDQQVKTPIQEIIDTFQQDWDWRELVEKRSIGDLMKLWAHPGIKAILIGIYEYDYEYSRKQRTFGHDLSCRKDFPLSLIYEHLEDTDIEWDWSHLTKTTPLEIIEQHPRLSWCMYRLSDRSDLTWAFLKKNLTVFDWRWDTLSRNKSIMLPEK
jgi:hypothetical protein